MLMNLTNKSKYILYIDESNILSKIGHSVYVGVYIRYLNKNILDKSILEIEHNLNIPYTHWTDIPWKLRIKLAQKIKNLDFECKIIIYKNPIVQNKALENFLLKITQNDDNLFKIIIDGKKSKKYTYNLRNILKDKGLKFNKIKFIDDKREPIIRIADFIAGFYRSFLDNKNKDNIFIYSLLKHKIKIPD